MDSEYRLEPAALVHIYGPSPLVSLLQRSADYFQQECYAEGFAILVLISEQLGTDQVPLAGTFDFLLQAYTNYQHIQRKLKEMNSQLANASAELHERAMLFVQTLPALIQDAETLHAPLTSLTHGNGLDPASLSLVPQSSEGAGIASVPDMPGENDTGPVLSITCFNHFEVRLHSKPMKLCSNHAGQSIFRYLITRSTRRATSDTLKELFWPQDEPAIAQRKLHHAISALRCSLETPVLTGPHSIRIVFKNGSYILDTSTEIRTDMDEFLACYRAGQQGSEERMALYERACRLYTGPFLTEDIYANWSALQREQLSKIYLTMCRGLAEHYSSIKRFEEAEKWATSIIKENPCDEGAHQQLMQLYAVQGRRSEAIRQYRHCERILREELGVQPMLETTALLKKILRQEGVSS